MYANGKSSGKISFREVVKLSYVGLINTLPCSLRHSGVEQPKSPQNVFWMM
jgi:hypothetical protein